MRLNTVRNRLLVLFFAITAGAIVFVYLYVVPQLDSKLTAEKLGNLQTAGAEQVGRIDRAMRRGASQSGLRRVIRAASQKTGGPVTVLGIADAATGFQPSFVVGTSNFERSAIQPSYPAAANAVAAGRASTTVERIDGERIGETAIVGSTGGRPRWVTVFTTPLADVDDNVALIRRQILIAGAIAITAALAAGWFAARAHSRRLRRLEAAAEQVAEGDFGTPIPVDSSDELGQLARSFNEMQRRLARLDSARREFIANASHELRTPIFSLGGFVELLEEEDPDPAVRAEFVRTMRGQIDRLTKLATDLLDLSKLDADAIEITRGRVDLAGVAGAVAEEFGPAAERHQSPVSLSADGRAAAVADSDRVAQILRILIDNALTHTPEGTAITISSAAANGSATLTVTDNGPGIDPHDRDRVFERFYTGDELGGSGLGLAIARELAMRMGGELGVASRRGRTQFELRLPGSPRAGARA
jgi:signal transduction histidine kinase